MPTDLRHPPPQAGPGDVFLASYTSGGGAHRWSKIFGGYGTDVGNAVTVDPSGNVYLTGMYCAYAIDAIDFGGGSLGASTGCDAFLASFTDGGSHRWSNAIGGGSRARTSPWS